MADVGVRARAGARYRRPRGRQQRVALAKSETLNTTRRPAARPLDGVRIVDLTAFWAGPAATHLLAAFGAEVIKVESIQRPDGIRYSGGMRKDVDDWWEYGWVFHAMNTNKRSVTLDLGSDEGTPTVHRIGGRRRRRDRELLTAGDGPVRADRRHAAGGQPQTRRRPHARLRAGRPVARTRRIRPHHGAACRTGLGDRTTGCPASDAARSLRSAGRGARRLRRAGRAELCRTGRDGSAARAAHAGNGVECHRDTGDRIRGLRKDVESPRQSRLRRGDPEPLPVCRRTGRRRLDRGHRARRPAVVRAG